MVSTVVFDTVYHSDGFYGLFRFESEAFPQGNAVALIAWAERRDVGDYVFPVYQTGATVVLRSRLAWSTREKAEQELARFLDIVERAK